VRANDVCLSLCLSVCLSVCLLFNTQGGALAGRGLCYLGPQPLFFVEYTVRNTPSFPIPLFSRLEVLYLVSSIHFVSSLHVSYSSKPSSSFSFMVSKQASHCAGVAQGNEMVRSGGIDLVDDEDCSDPITCCNTSFSGPFVRAQTLRRNTISGAANALLARFARAVSQHEYGLLHLTRQAQDKQLENRESKKQRAFACVCFPQGFLRSRASAAASHCTALWARLAARPPISSSRRTLCFV
jgi:hypothetical protein